MRDSSDNLVTKPEGKAKLFHQRFFPADLRLVNTIQHDDPPPLNTRTWANITAEEITEAFRTSSTKSAPGPSGIGYNILKWAHTARPNALTIIFNLCLETSKHPWNEATIIVLNKPQKPDYSVAKAYRPISLLECTGKVLEKIVTNRINADILNHDILPSTQFGSWPHHNTVDTVATLVHQIQATRAANCAGALLLFDISGFFDNLNPERTAQIFHDKGFPLGVCQWVLQFMTNRKAILKIGDYTSKPFTITHGTPQGSPLSPILSALYTANLLHSAKQWEHSDLTMYVDDGAIYATSRTMNTATMKACERFHTVLEWLYQNGLDADPAKTKLMTFKKRSANRNLIGDTTQGLRYTDPVHGPSNITVASTIRYLSIYLDRNLLWKNHVDIMANRARSTVWGISILGNTISGLNLLNWRKVYNALVIPILTYGAQVSPPRPGTNWADWSDAMGREMYLHRALDRLNFEYPSDDAS
jgi:hypothetical protein